MSKKVKMEDLNLDASTGTFLYVDIDIFRFLYDEEIFCLTVNILNGENYEFYEEVELQEDEVIVNHHDLKRVATGWILENVELIKKTAPEVPAQEQSVSESNSQVYANTIRDGVICPCIMKGKQVE